ncbi:MULTISPECIES: helix-turn-helix domain-containing protein [Bifidobacterium]|uniref:Transcriptional regulator, HipB-like protein n=2 Tax=Bifidobacterium TaxID=1678 RepID=A0A087CKJ7_9BIFI|nr:helix-turn-helix transcriptional regulator [Bifidobacterium psychraerophilum]KFI83797.1 transcriptional regulator, HipB-like protein [Bifidobacterium psychraerophilum]PKA94245.1 helix-turn-helix protein [Bifidobacterium psychraerophilum DSM 22366]
MEQFSSRIFSIHQIATVIKDARNARGWTQEELAAQTGFSRVWINRFEQSVISDPSFRRILAMCDVLSIDLSASYAPGKQVLPTRRHSRQRAKGSASKALEGDERTIRPQTVREAAAILESLARGTENGTVTANEENSL